MFESLQESLRNSFRKITGKAVLSPKNIDGSLTAIRRSLLEADVALPIVKDFIQKIKITALGKKVPAGMKPDQYFIKIVNDELINLMGETSVTLNLKARPPAVILMVGLQGSGKTTTTAKLAKYIKEHHKKSVAVASCDIYRPAAIAQLEQVAGQVAATFIASDISQTPLQIAKEALLSAKKQMQDVLIIDTAGRQEVDQRMMDEAKQLHSALNPVETLFVIDAMAGQSAVNTAQEFNQQLAITGTILTKVDGDVRGGAALTVKQVTSKPIKFYGLGEKLEALEVFHPERIASRILGMGDVLSLVEEIEKKIDRKKADKLAKKVIKGQGFTIADFHEYLIQLNNMGGIAKFMEKMPAGMKQARIDDRQLNRMLVIISSMTKKERIFTDLLEKSSRKRRIVRGSGTTVQDFNQMLKMFRQMQKIAKKLSGNGMMKMMKSMQDKLPEGFDVNSMLK